MNDAIDNDDDEFFNGNGDEIIKNCFYGVLTQNKNNENYMPNNFRAMAESVLNFVWPNNKYFGNCFKYLWKQYSTNVQNNLRTHCEKRLRQFFKMRAYELNDMILRGLLNYRVLFDARDIVNAVNYAYKRKITTQGDAQREEKLRLLLEELYYVGAPFEPHDEFNIRAFTEQHWLQSLRMWLNIQRDIDRFHMAFRDLNAQWQHFRKNPLIHPEPQFPEPPKINNFAAVPMCSFQRRHIQIDTEALHHIISGCKIVPKKISVSKRKPKDGQEHNWINLEESEFRKNKLGAWNLYFDMDKILQYVKNKKL